MHRLLIAVASPAAEPGALGKQASIVGVRWTQELWLPGPRAQAQQFWPRGLTPSSMWDPPGPGIEPMPPALPGRFFTTEPPGKPLHDFLLVHSFITTEFYRHII